MAPDVVSNYIAARRTFGSPVGATREPPGGSCPARATRSRHLSGPVTCRPVEPRPVAGPAAALPAVRSLAGEVRARRDRWPHTSVVLMMVLVPLS